MRLPITLALTHWNRFEMLKEAITPILEDQRIGEIVIVDDHSDDGSYQLIVQEWWKDPKFAIYRNERRIDCYANKKAAVSCASNPWVILFDSDNIISPTYLDAALLYAPWEKDHWYLPTFGRPDFDYRAFSAQDVNRSNLKEFIDQEHFLTALNTANYFVHRDAYNEAWDPSTDPGTADSIYMALRWLQMGGTLTFVPDMEYEHRIHDGSHFRTFNNRQNEAFKADVIRRLREL